MFNISVTFYMLITYIISTYAIIVLEKNYYKYIIINS